MAAQVEGMETRVAEEGQSQMSVAQLFRDVQVGADASETDKAEEVV